MLKDSQHSENGKNPSPRIGRISAILGSVVFFALSTATLTLTDLLRQPPIEQPISFNHRLHVEDAGLACLDCHEHYERETFSGLPSAEVCGFCHEEAQGGSAEEQRLVELLARGENLEWKRLFRQPPHVFYSHRRHVTVAGLECQTCHGSIAQSEAPPTTVTKLAMEDCIECHRSNGVTEDCTACHR